jgi:hypothetical protein
MTTETDLFALLPVELHLEIIKNLTFHGLFWARGINRFYFTECLRCIRSEYVGKYVIPRLEYEPWNGFSSSWMQIQRPRRNQRDDVYLWKRSKANQGSDKFQWLSFYLYRIVDDDLVIRQ